MEKRKVVIVTKYFGYNFTGATLATHELAIRWCNKFDDVIVVTKNIGEYERKDNLRIIKFDNNFEIIKYVKKIENENTIFYSDDHIAFLIKLAKQQYVHTYHATWPEARFIDIKYFIKSFVFIPLYKFAVKNSIIEIVVSDKYRRSFVEKLNSDSIVIRNGLGRHKNNNVINKNKNKTKKIIMIGNIDKRKYKKALVLFDKIENYNKKIYVDIYGRELDRKLSDKLKKYSFVNIKGFVKNIKISEYDLYISTSTNENLSIAACECIKAKIPVLGYDIGAMDEIIKNSDNGYLVKTDEELSKYLVKIIENEDLFDFKDKTIEEFDWDIAAEKYNQVFLRCKNERKNS